ncbi:tRNA lysidine(34) synthetase TilS [Streptococcus ictaluri]|uniref:tRNA(Ile)-lysidine synthase n=1 Tax=Streptococcus ictaluri 707-05 TaxID=764299 RepID=G5K0J6_9STRE|nr:tRNA lysidine(34) synthetase TilS [Streptococcus ictaluri]EHI70549.1 tRNA(Ile)-lysidine synthetase [Streptococcus ictaluri 707-05]
MTYQEIYRLIQSKAYFSKHQKVLIAVSGGVDSMNLLHFLHTFQKELGIEIGIAHVNHKQRQASEEEETYLKEWARKEDIPFHVAYFNGEFSEEKARVFRYQFFKQIMFKENYTALVTAHHADDQAETILMRLIRGSRLRHLVGIRDRQPFGNGELIRPFLTLTKADLPIPYHFEDHSNYSLSYFRNRVRHQYIETLKKENPNITQALQELSFESEYLFQAFRELTRDVEVTNRCEFLNQTEAVQYFLLQDYLDKIPELTLKKAQFKELLRLIKEKKQGTIYLKNQYSLILEEDVFQITKIIPKTEFKLPSQMLEYDSVLIYQQYSFAFKKEQLKKSTDIEIPLYSLSSIQLRGRQAGDSIDFGKFSKKLRRLFIDEKFTAKQRQNAIIGQQDNRIIFVIVGDKTYLRKASKHDIMLAKLYIDKLEKR